MAAVEDTSTWAAIAKLISDWGGPTFGASGLGAVFLAGRKVQSVKADLDDHEDRLAKQERDIEALKSGRAAADVKIAELPTRLELGAMRASIEARIEAGFAQLTNLIGQKGHH